MKSIPCIVLTLLAVGIQTRSARAQDDPTAELRIGLESYWPMNGTLDDWLTGTAGVVTGTASVEFGAGLDEGALIADVPGGGVALAHRITPGGGALSVSLWFTLFGLGEPGQVQLQDGLAWSLHRNGDADELAITAAGATLALPGDWEDGAWHHLSFTVQSGGLLTVRVDGAPGGETAAGTLHAGSGMITVGADPSHPADSVGLCLEEMAVWNRELVVAELESLEELVGTNLASVLGPAPANYVPANLNLVHDPDFAAILTWQVPPSIVDVYEIEASTDLAHWSVLGTAENSFRDPIPAIPGAKRFFRVYRKVEP